MIHVFAPVHAQLWTTISASPLENVALSIHHEGVKKNKENEMKDLLISLNKKKRGWEGWKESSSRRRTTAAAAKSSDTHLRLVLGPIEWGNVRPGEISPQIKNAVVNTNGKKDVWAVKRAGLFPVQPFGR